MECSIALFLYNRIDKAKKCIDALAQNPEAKKYKIYVFCDGPIKQDDENVARVRTYVDEFDWKKYFGDYEIILQSMNKGLANSIIEGISYVFSQSDAVIVLEDDLIVSRDFLRYMFEALDYYGDKIRYGSVAAYTPNVRALEQYNNDIYVTRKGECWGWGTWKDRWECVDWSDTPLKEMLDKYNNRARFESLQSGLDEMLRNQIKGDVDSWAIRWLLYLFNNDLWTVYPAKSKIRNIGNDGSGKHGLNSKIYDTDVCEKECVFSELEPNMMIERQCAIYGTSFFIRVKRQVKIVVHYLRYKN